jgi:suppressor of ftsI
MSGFTGRDFLARSGGVLVGAGTLGGLAGCSDRTQRRDRTPRWDLEAHWVDRTLAGTRARLRSYNGSIPGPMIMARPGELLRVGVRNSLTPYDSSGWNGDHNVPHMLDTTNLHLHGLEIVPHLFEPVGTSDATAQMIAIRPGEQKIYEFQIPDDQPPGLFWYHPHHHGSTAVQAVSGTRQAPSRTRSGSRRIPRSSFGCAFASGRERPFTIATSCPTKTPG